MINALIKKHSKFWRISLTGLVLSVSIFGYILAESSDHSKETVWTFDFRDTFFDIVHFSPQKAVIAGARGRILVKHSKFRNLWSPRDSGTRETLTCLSFVDDKNGWAAGHGGIVIKTADSGETWDVVRKTAIFNQPLLDLKFLDKKTGYACGGYDTILKTIDGGKTWTNLTTGTDYIFSSLDFYNRKTGFIAGEFGTIMKTRNGGKTWKKLNIGKYKGSILGIKIISPSKIIAFGIRGKLLISKNGGRTWSDIHTGVNMPLFRAAFNGKKIVIVGRSGVYLVSKDGGHKYTVKGDVEFTSFAGVCVNPSGGFTGVGERGKIYEINF